MKIILLLAFSLSFSAIASAESYLCMAELVSGFQYDKEQKTWVAVNYESDHEFTISRPTKADIDITDFTPEWVLQTSTDSTPRMYCKNDFEKDGSLDCTWVWKLHFNKYTLRYLLTYDFGYAKEPAGMKEGANEPHMEIGVCSQL